MSSPTESALVKPVRVDPVTEARLSRLAEETGRKKSFYRRELIEQGMDDLEDAYLGAVALEAHHRSGEATIPLDQVMGNLGMAD
jgi:RHH-type rel operon transcriptional repressor/antitoxin RelB